MGKKTRKGHEGRGWQVATLCVSTALVLILLGMVVFIGLTANNLSDYVKENLTVTVVFRDNVTNREAAVVCRKLQTRPWVAHLEYIDRDRALKEQTKALGTDPSEFLGTNPFVPSAEINLKANQANSDSLKLITKQIKAYKQVSEVTYQKDLMDKVNSNLHKVMLIMLIIALVLTCISFSLINNTVRLGIYERRHAIGIMTLVGASWAFIRKPFLKTAVLEGLIAGVLALLVLAAGVWALYIYEPDIQAVVTWQVIAITAAAVLFSGMVISTICVYISVTRYLHNN